MELPIDDKDLDTIINALALGGDTRLITYSEILKKIVNLDKKQKSNGFFKRHCKRDRK